MILTRFKTIEIFKDGEWVESAFDGLRKGDRFRLFDANREVMGFTDCTAKSFIELKEVKTIEMIDQFGQEYIMGNNSLVFKKNSQFAIQEKFQARPDIVAHGMELALWTLGLEYSVSHDTFINEKDELMIQYRFDPIKNN